MNRLARSGVVASLALVGFMAAARATSPDSVSASTGVDIVVKRVSDVRSGGAVLQVSIDARLGGKPTGGYFSIDAAAKFLRGLKGPDAPYLVWITTGVKLQEYAPLLDAIQQNPALDLMKVEHKTFPLTPVYEIDDTIR